MSVRDNDEPRMTVTRAKSCYKLTEDDLKGLDCLYLSNPHYRSAAPMRLYRISDLDIISDKKKELERRLQDEKNDKLYNERVDKLASKDMLVDEITEPFHDYVLGDYLTNKKSKITITSIKRHYPTMLLIKQHLDAQWYQPELIPYFHKYKGESNPMAMMMVVENALRTSNIIMNVISNNLLAYRITTYLDTTTLSSFESFLQRYDLSIQQPSDYIQSEIMASLNDNNLVNNTTVKEYISFAIRNPNLLGFTTNNITWFAQNNSEEARAAALTDALKQYSLDHDNDDVGDVFVSNQSPKNASFISKGYPSLSEVVALARITSYLCSFHNGNAVHYMNINEFERLLYRHMNDGISIVKATEKLLTKKPKQPRRQRYPRFTDLYLYDSGGDED